MVVLRRILEEGEKRCFHAVARDREPNGCEEVDEDGAYLPCYGLMKTLCQDGKIVPFLLLTFKIEKGD